MMRHDPKFSTFHGAYLNERVKFDLQNTFLEKETEDQLYKLFAHVSITRDPRAKRDMVPDEVWANLPPNPEIVKLEKQRTAFKQGQYRIRGRKNEAKIRELTEKIKRRRAQRENMAVRDYREYYFYHRPTWDVERQALGEVEEEYKKPKVKLNIPERARLADIWCNQPNNWFNDEIFHHRIKVIDLMVSFCNKRETRRRDHNRQRSAPTASVTAGFRRRNECSSSAVRLSETTTSMTSTLKRANSPSAAAVPSATSTPSV